jgi:hypothetical protein
MKPQPSTAMGIIFSKPRHVALPLVIAIGLLLISVRSSAQSEVPLGTYRVDADRSESLMNQSVRLKYDSLNSDAKSRARASLGDCEFRFSEGGVLEVKWKVNGTEETVTGKWG